MREAKENLGEQHTATAEAAGFLTDKQKIVDFLSSFVDSRFEDVTGSILTAMNIADFKMWHARNAPQTQWEEFGEEEVRDICHEYQDVLESVGTDIHKAQDEWTGLKLFVKTRPGTGDVSKMEWSSLRGRRDEFQNILTVVDFILTLPSHSADCERGISTMKRAKTDFVVIHSLT